MTKVRWVAGSKRFHDERGRFTTNRKGYYAAKRNAGRDDYGRVVPSKHIPPPMRKKPPTKRAMYRLFNMKVYGVLDTASSEALAKGLPDDVSWAIVEWEFSGLRCSVTKAKKEALAWIQRTHKFRSDSGDFYTVRQAKFGIEYLDSGRPGLITDSIVNYRRFIHDTKKGFDKEIGYRLRERFDLNVRYDRGVKRYRDSKGRFTKG